MMRSMLICLLCGVSALVVDAATLSDEAAACAARLQTLVVQAEQAQREAMAFKSISSTRFDPLVPLPPTRPGESAAAADGGLFFDNNASTLTYIGNVRLRDTRLHLRAANRLFLLFPANDKQKAENVALSGTQQQQRDVQPHPAQQSSAPRPVTAQSGDVATKSVTEEKAPPSIVTQNAAADLRMGRLTLEGRNNGDPSLILSHRESRVLLYRQGDGGGARVDADEQGNVLLRGGRLEAEWKGEDGERWKLVFSGEFVLYRAAVRELVFHGDTMVTTPQGTLHCARALHVFFSAAEDSAPLSPRPTTHNKKPFSQFEDMQLKEVDHIVAEGKAFLAIPSQQGRPTSRVTGETLHYSAANGECTAIGNNPTISFGENTLTTDDKIYLKNNGDIEVYGRNINGSYRRPTPEQSPRRLLVGTYHTTGPVTYTAATQTIGLPKGLDARDEAASFHCTGACSVLLLPTTNAGVGEVSRAKGQPNLAIARTDGIRELQAEGDVVMHSDASVASPVCDIHADSAWLDLQIGSATFRSKRGRPVDARYGDYALAARSPSGKDSYLQVLPNGDLLAKGEYVAASLPSEKGRMSATCADELRLRREKGVLSMGQAASIKTPDGIMTSRGVLEAELTAEKGVNERKIPGPYPHLAYNFTGLHTMQTHKGGTLRTAQVSMQCEGDIIVEIDPNAKQEPDRSSIHSALATNKVRLVSKDDSGRLVRADGDRLLLDPATKNIILTGDTVRLQDEFNIHSASGAGARITIDPKNNMRISGSQQTTHSVRIHEQIKKNKKKP